MENSRERFKPLLEKQVPTSEDVAKEVSMDTNGYIHSNDSWDSSADNSPAKGSLLLGIKDGVRKRYVTRFKIDRQIQHKKVTTSGVLYKVFCPFAIEGKNYNIRKVLWNFMRSDVFLVFLHLIVLATGVVKAALKVKEIDADLEIAHSAAEGIVVTMAIAIRMASSLHAYQAIKFGDQGGFEVAGDMEEEYLHLTSIKQGLIAFLVLGAVLMFISWASFFLFLFVPGGELSWTILTNNFCLVTMTMTGNMYMSRISKEISMISDDHHKAVIYETVLLLSESVYAKNKSEKEHVEERISKFCHALMEVERLKQPDYIRCPDKYKPHWDTITSLEIVSMV